MIRNILGAIDTGIMAQVGLLAFVLAFVAILIYTFTLRKSDRVDAKNLPLSDGLPANHTTA